MQNIYIYIYIYICRLSVNLCRLSEVWKSDPQIILYIHILGCPNKTFFKSSQVSPYRKFPYDQNIPHKKFQII